jgi:hypothetical protein
MEITTYRCLTDLELLRLADRSDDALTREFAARYERLLYETGWLVPKSPPPGFRSRRRSRAQSVLPRAHPQ